MTLEDSARWLADCRQEAAELVRLGAWTRKQADAAVEYLRQNFHGLENISTTEALDLARDVTA